MAPAGPAEPSASARSARPSRCVTNPATSTSPAATRGCLGFQQARGSSSAGALVEAHLRRHRISVAFRYGRKFGKSAGSAYPERTQVHAQMRLPAPACGARETHDVGVDGYPVANLERADVCTEVHDRSGELVPLYGRKDERGVTGEQAAVGPAYPAGLDPNDDFSRSCCGNRGFL